MTTTYKQAQMENLQARLADLEWQLQKIVAYVNETSVEDIVVLPLHCRPAIAISV
jgi:phosphoribosyl-dephospho-CoA transferase